MNDVEHELFLRVEMAFFCIEKGGFWADKNVSEVGGVDGESDAVSGSWVLEKGRMKRGDFFCGDKIEG